MRIVRIIAPTEELTLPDSEVLSVNEIVFDLDGGGFYRGNGIDTLADLVPVLAPGEGGGGSTYSEASNYSALPSAASNSGDIYVVRNAQGTRWLPGSLGGTYYPSGFYRSNGTTWDYLGAWPYAATQSEVNTGTATDVFVAPDTLSSYVAAQLEPIIDDLADHTHDISDTTGLQAALDGKASSTHSHAISDTTGLQAALDGKQPTGDYATSSALTTGLSGKADSSHTHAPADIIETATKRFVTDTEKDTWNAKQAALVSGTNIKTINGSSVLGTGDLTVSGSMPGLTSIVANSAAINTTDTRLIQQTISANTLTAGRVYRVKVYGTNTSTAASASNTRLRFGPGSGGNAASTDTLVAVSTQTSATSGTNNPFEMEFLLTIRTIGASGTSYGNGSLNNNGNTGISSAGTADVKTAGTAATINTTVDSFLSLWHQSAATTNTTTFNQIVIELVKS